MKSLHPLPSTPKSHGEPQLSGLNHAVRTPMGHTSVWPLEKHESMATKGQQNREGVT